MSTYDAIVPPTPCSPSPPPPPMGSSSAAHGRAVYRARLFALLCAVAGVGLFIGHLRRSQLRFGSSRPPEFDFARSRALFDLSRLTYCDEDRLKAELEAEGDKVVNTFNSPVDTFAVLLEER